jgi:hypothetical protein
MTDKELFKLALDALEKLWLLGDQAGLIANPAITALKERLAQPEQEPVAIPKGFSLVAVKGFDELMYWLERCEHKGHLENCPDLIEPYEAFEYRTVATYPPQRTWVGLTDEEREKLTPHKCSSLYEYTYDDVLNILLFADSKLRSKNQ